MDKEVEPAVLAFLNEKRLLGEKRTPADIITRMGVADARDKVSNHAWLTEDERIIVAQWAERIGVAANGRWFYLESLQPQQRLGGGDRSPLQIQRAKDRIQLLKFTQEAGETFRAVLQTNRVAIAEHETDKAARVSVRVQDDEEWHVAGWYPEGKMAVLVRGPRGWLPTQEDVAAVRARIGFTDETASMAPPQSSQSDVQAAAEAYLERHFAGYGYRIEQMDDHSLGYDIEVRDKKGNTLLKLVVRGTATGVGGFRLSATERACGKQDERWRLAVVTDAIGPTAQHKLYKGSEMDKAPGLEPLLD